MTGLYCSACGLDHDMGVPQNLCTSCGKPLFARYDLKEAARTLTPQSLTTRGKSLWRYREVLPVRKDEDIVTLGEGWTPMLHVPRLGAKLGMERLYIKDESQNPTQSFKARGMTGAVSMAKQYGLKKLAVPSAGNAAGALAAYAARAGIEAHIFMPADTPQANIIECRETGAHVTLINGLITDCGMEVAKRKAAEGWFDVSTLKEPFRVEGKKTLGYELAEQLDWKLPDAVLYPTGGGTGLIGMWKAFDEMQQMGWIGSERPRLYTIQASGCAPIVRAFEEGKRFADEFPNAATKASGLRVPKAIGDFLMLDALRASGGGVVAVPDEEMIQAVRELGSAEGIFAAPEGAACYAALKHLRAQNVIRADEQAVIFNTGAGVKYLECFHD
ncbi:threonine synthase [Terrimicrobium sacchariphilum]|jgi:threonine synthase|nr:threonine synthase [Terrimicrobium sacchariphilum]